MSTDPLIEPLPDRYEVGPLGADTGVSDRDVLDLWAGEGAMAPLVARRRLGDVVLVAVEAAQGLVGVCTVSLAPVARFGAALHHYRTFIAAEHRHSLLASHLMLETYRGLARNYESGADRSAPGLFCSIESEIVKRYRNQADWTEIGMAFIGEGERGEHLRVAWYPGAPVPAPAAPADPGARARTGSRS